MVRPEKYDSPQCGHDHMGMPSITSSSFPVPKLRVTRRNWTPGRPQDAHSASGEVDRDDEELPRVTDLDIFEIEDREIVIFKFFGCVKGYDVVQGPNEFANPSDRRSPHTPILLFGQVMRSGPGRGPFDTLNSCLGYGEHGTKARNSVWCDSS